MNFDKKIALFQQTVNSRDEALKLLANEFLKVNVVSDDFYEGIIEREKVFPTGLILENGMGVAIPHTELEKVKASQIGFMSLAQPVKFFEMGQENNEIEVSVIFMLALKEAHEQLDTLQRLMEIFQNTETVEKLKNCLSIEEYSILIAELGLL